MNVLLLSALLSSLALDAAPAALQPGGAATPATVFEAARSYADSGEARTLHGPYGELHPFGHSLPVVRCAPLTVCDVELEPGETVLDLAVGDSARWILGQMKSGLPAAPHVIVKPTERGLSTNLVITTDRRTYHLSLVSDDKAPTLRTGYYYPDELVRHLADAANAEAAAEARAAKATVAPLSVSDPKDLNFSYRIKPANHPASPLRAFDDGTHTYVQLRHDRRDTPALLGVSPDGKASVLNYRVSGDWFVVDGVLREATLVLGTGRRQTKISILNEAAR